MESIMLVVILVVILFAVIIIKIGYVKSPPNKATIISGLNKEPRVLIGKGGFMLPFFERKDLVYLGQITVDIKTGTSVPTNDFINVDIDAVAKIRVEPTKEGIQLAAKNFLNMEPGNISKQLENSLQGNMREIVGTLELKSLTTKQEDFSTQVLQKAMPDMKKLGIEIISCNIQNVSDGENLIKDLGADNISKIKKDASITKAKSNRDIEIESAKAAEESNKAKVESNTLIAEQNNQLEIKKYNLKIEADNKKAESDAAYKIKEQEMEKQIKIKTVEADIEENKKLQESSKEAILIKENKLAAEIRKQADADKYKKEQEAAAELEVRKRKAEGDRYDQEQKAEAEKKAAEAQKYRMLQEAEGIKAKGEAEAFAIREKGEAEAAAMEKKAEAYQKYNGAAVTEMLVGIMPEIAANVAKPIGAIDKINIYGTDGSGVSEISGQVPVIMKQVLDTMTEATGVDMKEIIKAQTYDAKVKKDINLTGGDIIGNIINSEDKE